MRNLSMKKFGTPIGAGPGSASEIVALPSVGRPSGCVSSASTLTLSPCLPSPDDEEDGAGGARSRAARRWLSPRLLRRLRFFELLRFVFELSFFLELLRFGADWRPAPVNGPAVVVGGGPAAGWSVSSTGPPRSALSSPPTGVSSSPEAGSVVEPVCGSVPVAAHHPGSAPVTRPAVSGSSGMWPPWSRHPADVSSSCASGSGSAAAVVFSTLESGAVPAAGAGDCAPATSTPTAPPTV